MSSSNADTLNFNINFKVKGKKRKGKKERKGKGRERGWGGKTGKKTNSSKENQNHVHLILPLHEIISRGESHMASVVIDLAETRDLGLGGTNSAHSPHDADFHPAPCVLLLLFSEIANFPRVGGDWRLKLCFRGRFTYDIACCFSWIWAESLIQQNIGKVLV